MLKVTFPFRIANIALHHYIPPSNPPSTLHLSTLTTTPSLFSPLLLFWTCGKRSRLILCGRHLFLPISTLLFSFPSSSYTPIHPFSIHSSQNKHSIPISNHSLPNTLLHNNQGNCLRSLMFHSLTRCKHTLHDQTRMTHQSPPYEPPRRSNNSRRTRLRHRTHLLNARVHCTALHCIATLNPD